jgi:hypothetical protein
VIAALIGADVSIEELEELDAEGFERLVRSIPTVWVMTELRRVRYRNPAQGFTPNDLNDLRALSTAIVYCDLVVIDKAWADAVRRTSLASDFATEVCVNLSDASMSLSRWRGVEDFESKRDDSQLG